MKIIQGGQGILRKSGHAWMKFWFGAPAPHALLALLRVGTSLILLYALFVRSFDLTTAFTGEAGGISGSLEELNPVMWRLSIFQWVDSPIWLWSMHILAIVLAISLLAGILTPLSAVLCLAFQLSYIHWNPVMMLGMDSLLILALFYLSLAPSGRMLTIFGSTRRDPPDSTDSFGSDPRKSGPGTGWIFWRWTVIRVIQIHLCLIYFQSALARLSSDWLAGSALWHPRLVELGVPFSLEALQGAPYLTSIITYGLVLFELFFGVLIWIPALRYPVLATAVLIHITVGITWNALPFNFMILVLNLVFVPAQHLEALIRVLRPILAIPWSIIDLRE